MGAASASFAEQLDALGIWWPHGDGDALRGAAQAWSDMADVLDEIGHVLDAVVAAAADGHAGEAATRFAEHWRRWSGPTGHLQVTSADCRRLAASLRDFGTDVDVADRAVALLAEQALEEIVRALLPETAELWTTWLHDSTAVLRDDLGARATVQADTLATLGTAPAIEAPHAPSPADVDPSRITWVDPGHPLDLSSVGTTVVDFGAGQGVLPLPEPAPAPEPVVDPAPTPAPTVDPSPATVPSVVAQPGGTNVVIVGNTGTINLTIDGTGPARADTVPMVAAVPSTVPPPAIDPLPLRPVSSTAGASRWSPSPYVAPTPAIDAPVVTDTVPTPVPISIDPPPSAFVPPVPAATAGVAAATTAAVAATAAKKSNGFMPFMPMGGSASNGDEGNEPRRRSARRPSPAG
jgi:uncharacterized protein YukE